VSFVASFLASSAPVRSVERISTALEMLQTVNLLNTMRGRAGSPS
jgi:hypothetical protein